MLIRMVSGKVGKGRGLPTSRALLETMRVYR
jgi:hypothetical protein